MKFDRGIDKKYRKSVEDAFETIVAKGNDFHRHMMNEIIESDLLVQVLPVSKVNASGITGVINSVKTNYKLATERLSLRESLGEIYIAIAEETIDTGGQRGCEGTFVHEGRHAYDFAQTLESLSNADMNPIGIFNPTLYELEWEAHKTAGDYMLCRDEKDFIDEGLQLMILCQADGKCSVSDDGIMKRLNESYGLDLKGNPGSLASEMMGLRV
ncbi:MAG TPA: hypothetical protein PLL77_00890 [Pyrinomonadaceae bacterium]|nr:hypothetical protein [Pyrinomonadaceae bacterium]